MLYAPSSQESFNGPETRAILWREYGKEFLVEAASRPPFPDKLLNTSRPIPGLRATGGLEPPMQVQRQIQIDPKCWHFVTVDSPAPRNGYYEGKTVVDPTGTSAKCLIRCLDDPGALVRDRRYLARVDGSQKSDDGSKPVFIVQSVRSSPAYQIAESVNNLADGYLRRACMHFVLGGKNRYDRALADLQEAMKLTPERTELMLPALTLRSRLKSAIALAVSYPNDRAAKSLHDEAVNDANAVVAIEAKYRDENNKAGDRDPLALLWRKVPPPVQQELQRRRDAAYEAGYDNPWSEISMTAALDMDQRGFNLRFAAEAELSRWMSGAKQVAYEAYGPGIIPGPLWDLKMPADRIEGIFKDAVERIGTIDRTVAARTAYREKIASAEECFKDATAFAPDNHRGNLASVFHRRDISVQDWAWTNGTILWSTFLQRLNYEHFDRLASWRLTASEYFQAVGHSVNAALLKPQVATDRDLRDWFIELKIRN